MKRNPGKHAPAPAAPGPPDAGAPPKTLSSPLRWASLRTALSLFAAGWMILQASSLLLLLVNRFVADLDAAWLRFFTLLLSVAYIGGLTLLLTGMGMSCVAPPESPAQVPAYGTLGCLIAGGAAWAVFNLAGYQKQEVIREIQGRAAVAQKKNAGRRERAELKQQWERELEERTWGPKTLGTLMLLALGGLCGAKVFFTLVLRAVARHFRRQVLASGLLIYLIAEVCGVLAVAAIWGRQQPGMNERIAVSFLSDNGYALAVSSAFCAWFLVYLFQVRRTLAQALLDHFRSKAA